MYQIKFDSPYADSNHYYAEPWTQVKVLSYNIQAGIQTQSHLDYIINSWKYVLPHPQGKKNLKSIARVLREFDIIALQEVDSGSWRSGFVNQIEYLAKESGIPYWHSQINRNLGKLGQMSNGILSRIAPTTVSNYKLPSAIPGRGAMMMHYGDSDAPLVIINLHLSLSARARSQQLNYIAELIRGYEHVILLGDMNCHLEADEMILLMQDTNLQPTNFHNTFPSWAPSRNIDNILVSRSLQVNSIEVLPLQLSDHRPLAMTISMPSKLLLS